MHNADEVSTFDNQYYPTPRSLALRMLKKFKNREIERLLDPQGGRGDLVDVVKERLSSRHGGAPTIECVEIDLANQAILRAKGYRVVGTDFLKYRGASVYSHILTNPPFKTAVKHILHAWDLLFTGEISGILPARCVKHPTTPEQKRLALLIAEHGTVEYLSEAFLSEDTKRTTRVDIALIHLLKVSPDYTVFIDGLRKEVERRHEPARESFNELIVPRSFIETLVLDFECAAEAAKQAAMAQRRADHYASRFSGSIATDVGHVSAISKTFNQVYDELKERAWSTVLRSTSVLERLSSAAQRRVEAQFEEICALEFTYENIWGFFEGIIAQQTQIQTDMICDVFDTITRYHTENRAYYQGWKSNDKHRLNAFRLKTTRFILPNISGYQGTFSLSWENAERFRDFDKVFAMLDGKKPESTFGIEKLFDKHWDGLCSGERWSSDYFDARYYPRAGTFHLFPRRKDLIERMNRVVGEQRHWLPHEKSAAPQTFWQQFEAAEKITARMPNSGRDAWFAFRSRPDDEDLDHDTMRARTRMFEAHTKAMAELGIDYDASMLLKHEAEQRDKTPKLPCRAA